MKALWIRFQWWVYGLGYFDATKFLKARTAETIRNGKFYVVFPDKGIYKVRIPQ